MQPLTPLNLSINKKYVALRIPFLRESTESANYITENLPTCRLIGVENLKLDFGKEGESRNELQNSK